MLDQGFASPRVHAAFVLCHPELDRVGEALGWQERVEFAADEGVFGFPGAAGNTLGEAALGQTRVCLHDDGERLTITVRGSVGAVSIDGEAVGRTVEFPLSRLHAGVCIRVERTLLWLARGPAPSQGPTLHGLIGVSAAIEGVRSDIELMAGLDLPVLIRGETGTGKERVARAIHAASGRAKGPFICVNMAALAPSTATSELFGHRRGAFTDAVQSHVGAFGLADGGTLFLDEIGETPLAVQNLLLRALDEGEVQPVGGTTQKVDVRLLTATDADLEQAVGEGSFRDALLHRIAVCNVQMPSLRRRCSDVAMLVAHFLLEHPARAVGGTPPWRRAAEAGDHWLSPATMLELVSFDWPGNVRQLRNTVTEMGVRCWNQPRALPPASWYRSMRGRARTTTGRPRTHESGRTMPVARRRSATSLAARTPADIPDHRVLEVLRAKGYSINRTAKALGIAKNTLIARMKGMPGVRRAVDLERRDLDRAWQDADGSVETMAQRLEVSSRALKLRITALEWRPAPR